MKSTVGTPQGSRLAVCCLGLELDVRVCVWGGWLWRHKNTFPNSTCPYTQAHLVADLQCGQVASQLFNNGFEGTGLGLGITHEAQVEEEGIAAVLLVFYAHRATDQLLFHGRTGWVEQSQPDAKPVPSSWDPSTPTQLGPHTVISLFCSSGLVMMYTWTVSNSSREMKSSGTWERGMARGPSVDNGIE